MKFFQNLLILLIFSCFSYLAVSQSITVIFINGDVKSSGPSSQFKKLNNLVFGPVSSDQILVLPKNSSVKLIKEGGYDCEISKPGSYMIKDLKFEKIKEQSTLGNFINYFKSFFVAHPSSESKDYYNNSIYAISRGELVAPVLEFPFSGNLALHPKGLNFFWGSSCDSCHFVFRIQDFASKEILFTKEVKDRRLFIPNPQNVFKINQKYIWSVSIKNSDIKSDLQSFTITNPNEYQKIILDLEKSFKKNNPYFSPVTQMASVLCALEEENHINYMIQYGQEKINKNPKNQILKDFYDRVYYDHLKSRKN